MENHIEIDRYSTFPVFNLVDNSFSDFDLYIHIENHFILYSPPGYHWLRCELNDLIGQGHEAFYIKTDEEYKAKMYLELAKLPGIEKDLAPKERIQSIEQVGASFIKCLHEGDITPACVQKGRDLSSSITDCVLEDASCIQHLSGLADKDFYTYYHSIRVATYSTAIAIEMGITDKRQLTDIALGGIFHDIGKKDVPLSILNKQGPLNDVEWNQMRAHPTVGHDLVMDSVLSHVPRQIVLHHHEKLSGKGYPHGLDKYDLLPEVQIATLADIFDALTSSRTYQNKRTRYEALDLIKHKLLKEDVSVEAFKALISCLIKSS